MRGKVLLVLSTMALAACQTTGSNYKPVSESLPKLGVKYSDAKWDGKAVPMDGACIRNGGKGVSPAMVVTGIPAGVNAIIVEYSDRSYSPMNNGGHGKIGFAVAPGADTVTLPSIPGSASKGLPEGVWIEGNNLDDGRGYLGPCSGGRGNTYEADLMAVSKPAKEGEQGQLFATGRIGLGRY